MVVADTMDDTIKALQEGNQKVFGELFDTYYEALCRYAFSILKDSDETKDTVQKVFCKLWDQRLDLDIRTSLKSYLYRMTHNESLNYIHQQTNRGAINLEIVGAGSENTDDVNEHIMASDLQQAIDKALESLAPQCRKVFEMSRMEQRSYSEIANILQISVNTVENHISKALRIMRVALKDYLILLLGITFLK